MSTMTSDEFVGRVIAFKGEDEYIGATNVLLEVTEVDGMGFIYLTPTGIKGIT